MKLKVTWSKILYGGEEFQLSVIIVVVNNVMLNFEITGQF